MRGSALIQITRRGIEACCIAIKSSGYAAVSSDRLEVDQQGCPWQTQKKDKDPAGT
jgi:hypothetical protein